MESGGIPRSNSTQGKKDLIKNYRGYVEDQRKKSRSIISKRTAVKDVFKVLIAILLSSTTLTSMLQFTGKEEVYKFVIVISSILSSLLTSIYSTLDLENSIIKNDHIAISCESLLLEIDRFLLTTKAIEESEIDQLILKINSIISLTSVEKPAQDMKASKV